MKTAFFRTLSPYKRRHSQQTAKSVYYARSIFCVAPAQPTVSEWNHHALIDAQGYSHRATSLFFV